MKRLSKEGIKNLPDVPTKIVELPNWDVSIKIQGISKAMQIELGRIIDAEDTDAFDYQRQLLKACVIEPELDDELINDLYKKDSSTIDLIFSEINNLNGIGGGSSEDEQFRD